MKIINNDIFSVNCVVPMTNRRLNNGNDILPTNSIPIKMGP